MEKVEIILYDLCTGFLKANYIMDRSGFLKMISKT